MQNIPAYRWPPTQRLLAARFLANLEQLQNRDFAISNRSKPIWVLTRTKCSCSDDRLSIGYSLSDFSRFEATFCIHFPFFTTSRKGVDTRGDLAFDSLKRIAYLMFLMHLPSERRSHLIGFASECTLGLQWRLLARSLSSQLNFTFTKTVT